MKRDQSSYGDGASVPGEYARIYLKYQNKIHEFHDKKDWNGLID